jgi:hypothetical protein
VATGNSILSNLIYANNGIPIDLAGDGPTSNDLGDADTGPNTLQNFPTVEPEEPVSGYKVPGNTMVIFDLNSVPNADYTLQFYRYNPEPELLGTQTTRTDEFGNDRIPFYFTVPPGQATRADTYYAATATDAAGNTSELTPAHGPVQLANLSTRANILTGDEILIGGFIIRSDAPKKVMLRAIGPSLHFYNGLADPVLELYDSSGTLLAKNDDWRAGQQQEVIDSGIAPSSDLESALIATLPAGAYTAQVRGANNGTGIGVVEIYDLDRFPTAAGRLVNISSRAFVSPSNDLIGGLIVRGDRLQRVIVRGIAADVGSNPPLPDPSLELRDAYGHLLASDEDWRDRQEAEISDTGLAPTNDRDAAIVLPLPPGAYTALLRDRSVRSGMALIEFYDLTN